MCVRLFESVWAHTCVPVCAVGDAVHLNTCSKRSWAVQFMPCACLNAHVRACFSSSPAPFFEQACSPPLLLWSCACMVMRFCVLRVCFSMTPAHTYPAAVSVRFKIVLLIARDTAGSAPQVIFYCSLSSIRVMLPPVLPDSCYITASLCVFLCHRLNDWTDLCFILYSSLSYWLVLNLSGTIPGVVDHRAQNGKTDKKSDDIKSVSFVAAG